MRDKRSRVMGWAALGVAALFALHPLLDAVHFIVIEHAAVTELGSLAHHHHNHAGDCSGHHDAGPADAVKGPAWGSPEQRSHADRCGYEDSLFRTESADEVGPPTHLTSVLVALESAAAPSANEPRALALLFLAPKQSPPVA